MSLFCNSLEKKLDGKIHSNELLNISVQIETDEVFVEWIFDEFRLGFLFCDDPNESGWNIVTNTSDGVQSISVKFDDDISSCTSKIAEHMAGIA